MARTVSSRSVTTPLRIPVDGASPTPRISSPSGPDEAMTAHVFVVPMSRPAIVSPLAIHPPLHLHHHILWPNRPIPTKSSTVIHRSLPIPGGESSAKFDGWGRRGPEVQRTD